MKKITLVVAIMLLSSCKTRTVVMTVPEVRTDTLIITKSQRDSIWLHDSIHVSEKTKGDTVFLEVEKWHDKYIETRTHDTIYISKHDTIPQPYPVEVIKEVEKELNWLERSQMYTGKFVMWLLLAGAALFIFKILR